MQTKQEMLLQRADQLDQECEKLQNRLLEIEDERERLLNEKEFLESKNENAEKASADLKVRLYLMDMNILSFFLPYCLLVW